MRNEIFAIALSVLLVAPAASAQPEEEVAADEAAAEETVAAEAVAGEESGADETSAEEPAYEEPEEEPAYEEPAEYEEPAVAAAPTVGAAAMTTGLGIGLGTTLGNTSGVLASFFFTPELGIQLGIGGQFLGADGDNGAGNSVDISSLGAAVGAYCVYRLLELGDLSFNLLGGVEVVYLDFEQTSTIEVPGGDPIVNTSEGSSIDLAGAAGIQAEWFVADDLSLFAHTGVVVTYLGQVGAAARTGSQPTTDADASGLALRVGPAHIGSMFGFTWWL